MSTFFLVLVGSEGSSVHQSFFRFFISYLRPPACTPERAPFSFKCLSVCKTLRQRFTTAQFASEPSDVKL